MSKVYNVGMLTKRIEKVEFPLGDYDRAVYEGIATIETKKNIYFITCPLCKQDVAFVFYGEVINRRVECANCGEEFLLTLKQKEERI